MIVTESIKIEAEDMYSYGGFREYDKGDGGKGVKLACDDWGKLSKKLDCDEGEYDFKINVQDECDGQSSLKIYIDGEYAGTIKLDQDTDGGGSDYGPYSTYTLPGLKVPADADIKIIACGDKNEFVRIDCIELCPVEPAEKECEPVTLLHEDFNSKYACDPDDLKSITEDGGKYGWDLSSGKLKTSGGSDGELKFKAVGVDEFDDLCVNFKIKTPDASQFENSGHYADVFKIYILTDQGKILLDEFKVNDAGTALVNINGDKQFSGDYTELSYDYELPDGATWAKLIFDSHITACNEKIYIDDVKIKGKVDCPPPPPPGPPPNDDPEANPLSACDCADETPLVVDLNTLFSDEDSDSVALAQLDSFVFADATGNGSFTINGATGTKTDALGATSDFAVDGLSVSVVDGVASFDGQSAFEALDYNESVTVTVSYTVEDSDGGTASEDLTLTFCGVAEEWDEQNIANLEATLPSTAIMQIVDETNPLGEAATIEENMFTLQISGTGTFLDGVYANAFCVDKASAIRAGDSINGFSSAPEIPVTISILDDDTDFGGNIWSQITNEDWLDNMITWILNQDGADWAALDTADDTFMFENGVNDAEIQSAIWGITNSSTISPTGPGDPADYEFSRDDANKIRELALEFGTEFVAKGDDLLAVFLDPSDPENPHKQPFVVGIEFDDCICIC